MKAGDRLELRFEKPVYGGDFLAHHDGQAVFVPFVLPGETARVRVLDVKRHFARARVEAGGDDSAHRVEPSCAQFGQCGGCHYQHATPELQVEFKKSILEETLRRSGVVVPVPVETLSGPALGYRNRIRLAVEVDAESKSLRLGYRARFSHEIIEAPECPVSAPVLLPCARKIAGSLLRHGCLENEMEMELMTTPTEDAVMITLLLRSPKGAEEISSRLEAVFREQSEQVIGITLAVKAGEDAARILAHAGKRTLNYSVGGIDYSVPAGAFFQTNRFLLAAFRDQVTRDAHGETAWDLFAGVGFFARALEQKFAAVVGVEASEASFPSLQTALSKPRSRAVLATTQDFLEENRLRREPAPDWIIFDPPRAGLEAKCCSLLNAIHAPRMTYVSCDPVTMARDLKLLTAERFQIESIHLVDLFPQTFHFESVVQLSRRR